MLKQILQGMVVGIANIIPGVSGGTMMVAMGLYDKLIHSITHLKSEFKQSMKLLIPIFAGAGIAWRDRRKDSGCHIWAYQCN